MQCFDLHALLIKRRCVHFHYYNSPSSAIDLVIEVYTNKQMLVGVYQDPRRSSTTSKSAESGNYEAFVTVFYCHFMCEVMF